MKENDELTYSELKNKLVEDCNVTVSEATIRQARRKIGWIQESAKYCQMVREPNKVKRLMFCLKALTEKDTFENVIFTDETSVQIQQHARLCFRKNGSQPKRKGRPKHPLKVYNYTSHLIYGFVLFCLETIYNL